VRRVGARDRKPKRVSRPVPDLARRWASDREKVFSAERIKANDAEAERLLSLQSKGIRSAKGYRVGAGPSSVPVGRATRTDS
jgi:hypothetical protein